MTSDSGIRASDSDREKVVAIVRDAYAAGRLTLEEFDERTSVAFSARTWGELRELTSDLPQDALLGADTPRRGAGSPARQPELVPEADTSSGLPRRRFVPMLVPVLMVWLIVGLTSHDVNATVTVLVALLLLLRLASRAGRNRSRWDARPPHQMNRRD